MKKGTLEILLILVLTSMLTLAFNIRQTECPTPPETEWNQTYGGTSDDQAYSVVQTGDGGYAIAGSTNSFGVGGWDFWLVRTDSTGNMQWNQTYGGTGWDRAYSVVQTGDGGYAIAGYTESFGAGGRDFWLVKTYANGNMQWNQTYGGTSDDESGFPYSLVQTGDGGYAIAGWTDSFGAGTHDMWLVKTYANGTMEWNQTYGGTGWDEAYSVVQTGHGGYAIAGYTKSFGVGGWDVWLVKTYANGTMEWNKPYGNTYDDYGHCVQQTGDGGYVIAGITPVSSIGGSFDWWLIKTDAAGNVQWSQTFGGTGRDDLNSVVETGDGGYVLAGDVGGPTKAEAGDWDFWLIKLAPVVIPATVDVDPDTLNLKSNGEWITAYITLPEEYNVENIVLETVEIEGIQAVWAEIQGSVYMVKFDRATVRDTLTGAVDYEGGLKFYDLIVTVKGQLVDGTPFEGSDAVTVIKK